MIQTYLHRFLPKWLSLTWQRCECNLVQINGTNCMAIHSFCSVSSRHDIVGYFAEYLGEYGISNSSSLLAFFGRVRHLAAFLLCLLSLRLFISISVESREACPPPVGKQDEGWWRIVRGVGTEESNRRMPQTRLTFLVRATAGVQGVSARRVTRSTVLLHVQCGLERWRRCSFK